MESLANKWRPKCFAEVIGQPTIISILSKQIETKTFKQAYLFAGPSGCGKTTCARLLHIGINNNEGTPIEINAANNNGIDIIRSLTADALQVSIDCDYKIYIIDECHQLTRAAWDAALKLIEEPPSNAIFIFCTTNPNKVPETIMTRVQRFDFKRVPAQVIADRLEFILNEEEPTIVYEKESLYRIAIKANGFVREAISLLDMCISSGLTLTVDNVCKLIGVIKYEVLLKYTKAVLNKDSNTAIEVLHEMIEQESNLTQILDNIIEFFINCEKAVLTKGTVAITLPSTYIKEVLALNEDFMTFVDRAFKYGQLRNVVEIDSILNMLTLELCRR